MSIRRRTAGQAAAVAVLIWAAGLACPAAAEQADTLASSAAAVDQAVVGGAAQVDELVVTARRRIEYAQDVPIALSVVTGESLERTGTYSVGQLTNQVPSLQLLSSNPRNTAITIRGLGASYGLANDGLEQGVGIYVDQVYNSRAATATLDFVDIDRIEVLRGPQGTLFGKNTTAGALNITTKSPSFTPEGAAELSVGDHNFIQGKGTISGPIFGDVVAGRLSFTATRRDGFLENVTTGQSQNDQNNFGVRGQLLIKPTDRLSVRLFADYNRQELECCTQVFVTAGQTLKPPAQQFPALAAGRGYAPPSLNYADRLADVDSDIQADQRIQGAAAIVDYDLGFATLTSVSAIRYWEWDPANDRDYTALDIVRQSANPSFQDQVSQEVRLASNGSNTIDWVVGAYFYNQDVKTTGVTEWGRDATYWLLAPNLPDALLDGYYSLNTSRISTDSYAVFGQFTWNITDNLRLAPGLRYTWEEKDGYYALTTGGGLSTTDATLINRRLGIARPQFYEAEISDGSLSGNITLSYDVTEDVLAYGSYARGYKSGGINMAGVPTTPSGAPALNNAVVEPEEVTTYEIGLKTQLFNRLLTANVAAYYTDIRDFQANVVDSGPGALRGYLANIEQVEVKGVEADVVLRPTNGWSAYATLSWTDGKYSSFKNGPCPLERVGTSTAACDLSGAELPGVSPWAGAAGVEYRQPGTLLGLNGEAYVGADGSFRSAYFSDASASIYTRIDSYELLNLRAGFKSDANWEAFLWVKNVLAEDYLQFVSVQSGNSGLVIGNPGDPRTVGATLRVRY